jgi:hypothetical protein
MTDAAREPRDPSDVRRQAMDSVAEVFESLVVELGDVDRPAGAPRVQMAALGSPVHPQEAAPRAREAIATAVTLFGDIVLEIVDRYADLVEQQGQRGVAADATDGVVTLTGFPGRPAEALVWVHNVGGVLAGDLELRLTALTAIGRAEISGATGSFTPPLLHVAAAEPGQTSLRVDVPAGASPGTYYGHVLVVGLPEVALSVRLVVEPS